jgi:hypothetical protein
MNSPIHMSIRYIPVSLNKNKKKITESSTSASYLDVLLKIDTGSKLTAQPYNKLDDFNFAIVNFLYRCVRGKAATSQYYLHLDHIHECHMHGLVLHIIKF